jgi:hypothetical protein
MHQIASPKTVKHPECPADAVIVNVPFSDLGKIAGSSSLIIGALGFTMRMKPADIQSLRRFMRTVRDGVRIEKAVALPGSTVNSCGLQKIERARAELESIQPGLTQPGRRNGGRMGSSRLKRRQQHMTSTLFCFDRGYDSRKNLRRNERRN